MARTIQARVLACPNCGAKLRWSRDAPIIECRYCHAHVAVETGRTTHLPAQVVSSGRGAGAWVAGTFAAALVAGVVALAIGGTRGQRSSATPAAATPMSTMAEVATTSLAATPAQVAARHRVPVVGTNVRVLLSDGPFREVTFGWEADSLDHVTMVQLRPRTDGDPLADVVARARAQLGRRLRAAATGGYQFGAKGVAFVFSSTVQISANRRDDAAWTERFAAMWTVMKGAALGTADQLDDRTRRDVLDLAYPVTVLNAIDFDVVVDDAAREIQRVAPGADHDGARHTIGFDHPWFESAWLTWNNAPGGQWTHLTLYYPAGFTFATNHAAIAACLTPVLGEPKKQVRDHLAGTFTLQYVARGGKPWVDVSENTVSIYPRYAFGAPATAAGLHALITALAACGA